MAENSKIEWTDHTFNPWIGCTKVSPGCAHCYAENLMDTRYGRVKWGNGQPRQRTSAANWKLPLKWNRDEGAKMVSHEEFVANRRPRVFCASLADWLDDEVPTEWLADLLELIRVTPHLDWLLLTKRPQNWEARLRAVLALGCTEGGEPSWWYLAQCWSCGVPPDNVWIGTTVEDQQRADERIPDLIGIPARLRFLSCEPLLGPVEIEEHLEDMVDGGYVPGSAPIHWVICGGESGPGARPMHPDWARSLRDQCQAAGVAYLFKQWGEWLPGEATPDSGTAYRRCDTGEIYATTGQKERQNFGTHLDINSGPLITLRVGKHAAGRLLDGREWNEFPAV